MPRLRMGVRLLLIGMFLLPYPLHSAPSAQIADGATLTHGIASGDVTSHSVVIWSRANHEVYLHVAYDRNPDFSQPKTARPIFVTHESDYTGQVMLTGLQPSTRYYYRVWLTAEPAGNQPEQPATTQGSFTTAPDGESSEPVAFVFGGDLGGQGLCRHHEKGYAIFTQMAALKPDFFVANGDMIYADDGCPPERPLGAGANGSPLPIWKNIPGRFPGVLSPTVNWTDLNQLRRVYRRHWQYNRADLAVQHFFQHVPMYAQWDDHEVLNDFGARWTYWAQTARERIGYPNLVTIGRETFFLYSPMARHPDEFQRIYRAFQWGQQLDLFLLDARSYRSRNDLPDTQTHQKTLLGSAQLAWLKQQLQDSQATWKIVSSDVPLSVPTGSQVHIVGRDGWANGNSPDFSAQTDQTGFERELLDLLHFLDETNVNNIVFITTDVHFAAQVRYALDANEDGDLLIFHELITGPLNAGMAPAVTQTQLDPTLNPTLLYAQGDLFNFGFVQTQPHADGTVHLIADVRAENGQIQSGSVLDLSPQ